MIQDSGFLVRTAIDIMARFTPLPTETQTKSGALCSRQFLGNVLVEDFLHGQGDDDFVAALEK
jgi:hypothetical protein